MIHDFDLSNFIMDELPVTISAVGHSLINPEIGAAGDVDTAVVTMIYADEKIAVIKNSRRAAYGCMIKDLRSWALIVYYRLKTWLKIVLLNLLRLVF